MVGRPTTIDLKSNAKHKRFTPPGVLVNGGQAHHCSPGDLVNGRPAHH
jgi:hypothetical protein